MMKTSILLLIVGIAGFFLHVNTQAVCPLAQMEKEFGFGLCQSRGQLNATKCQEQCQKYADVQNKEVVASECTMANEHADCKPVCICKLKCYTAGSTGDPHYVSWDIPAPTFDYMALKKHYLIKPCQKYNTLPNFEVRQTNRPYSGAISVADLVELVVPEWERVLEVKIPMAPGGAFELTTNGRKRDIPYHYPDPELGTCSAHSLKVFYKDPATKSQVIVETSFGLRITIAFAYVMVDIPKHPELKAKACGILGTPNGNPADDCRLSTGAACTHQPGFDPQGVLNRPFGDSWIVPGQGAWSADCFPPEELKKTEEIIKNTPPEVKKRIEQLCRDNAGHPAVADCAKKLGRPHRSVEECIFDAQFLTTEKEQNEFVKTIVQTAAVSCDVKIPFIESKECCPKNLSPLFRTYSKFYQGNYYTVSIYHAAYFSSLNDDRWSLEGSPGLVATTPKVCQCDVKRIIQLHRPGKPYTHYYTTDPAVAQTYMKQSPPFLEYNHGDWYCSTTPQCGATLALKTYALKNGAYVFTPNPKEGAAIIAGGGKDAGILCYIWPHTVPADLTKMSLAGVAGGDYN